MRLEIHHSELEEIIKEHFPDDFIIAEANGSKVIIHDPKPLLSNPLEDFEIFQRAIEETLPVPLIFPKFFTTE